MSFNLQGVHHVGLTVSDMKRSFEWYSRMFGVVPGPVNHGSGPDLERGVGVEGAALTFSMIDIGNAQPEFLEYCTPTASRSTHATATSAQPTSASRRRHGVGVLDAGRARRHLQRSARHVDRRSACRLALGLSARPGRHHQLEIWQDPKSSRWVIRSGVSPPEEALQRREIEPCSVRLSSHHG
jgi:catechol 2,3-dioxygenase-like lactoylglutathione lyase family enzyme